LGWPPGIADLIGRSSFVLILLVFLLLIYACNRKEYE